MVRKPTHKPPTHPGEMLLEEFLIPNELSADFWLNLQSRWDIYHVQKAEESELKTILDFKQWRQLA